MLTKGVYTNLGLVFGMLREHPKHTFLVILASILTGLFESVGLLTLIPLLSLVSDSGETGNSDDETGLQQIFHSTFEWLGLDVSLSTILIFIIVTIVLKGAGQMVTLSYIGVVHARIGAELRKRVISSIATAKWGFFVSHPVGHFANGISQEANRSAGVYKGGVLTIATLIQCLILLVGSSMISWEFTLGAIILGGVMSIILSPFIKMTKKGSIKLVGANERLAKVLVDSLNGFKPIKAMGAANKFMLVLSEESEEIRKSKIKTVIAKHGMNCSQEPIIAIVLCSILFVTLTFDFYKFSELLVLLLILHRTASKIIGLQSVYQTLINAIEFYKSYLKKVVAAEKSAEELPQAVNKNSIEFNESLALENASFWFADKQVFQSLNVSFPFGSLSIVQGASGGGKTTLIDLISGLYLPKTGKVTIDGEELTVGHIESWRSQIGYVGQEIFLYHTDLRDNIILGQTEFEGNLDWALERSCAAEFVDLLPDKLGTEVGERGMALSGGQRQRIALARALVRKPRLLILDEVTTSLDTETERKVMQQLVKLKGEMTIILVSHQQATTEFADQVISVSGGKIAENSVLPAVGSF